MVRVVVAVAMRNSDWRAIYEEILADFGFDRARDEEAMRIASDLIAHKGIDSASVEVELERRICGKEAMICGNAPCLERDIMERGLEYHQRGRAIIAADGATSVLIHNAILPDVIVSDLDGYIPDIIYANRLGSILIVHAHGDNIKKLRGVLPAVGANVMCTAQSGPITPRGHIPESGIFNFGGFTDGDRCVFIAKEFGAIRIELLGFDFEDTGVTERKRRKLKWAKRLIEYSRRGE